MPQIDCHAQITLTKRRGMKISLSFFSYLFGISNFKCIFVEQYDKRHGYHLPNHFNAYHHCGDVCVALHQTKQQAFPKHRGSQALPI